MVRSGRRKEFEMMNRFMKALESFSASYARADAGTLPYSICLDCLDRLFLTIPSGYRDMGDHGACACCGQVKQVYDLGLLKFYREIGIPKDIIGPVLPRLRRRFPYNEVIAERKILSLIDGNIDQTIRAVQRKEG